MFKRSVVAVLAVGLLVFMEFPTFAASKKKISTVSLRIDADIEIGSEVGEEEIEVETSSDKYSVDGYELVSDGFEWESSSLPELEITLSAADDYYFAISKASSVKMKGDAEAKYLSGRKTDSSQTLILTVQLDCVKNGIGRVENVHFEGTKGMWESASDGNSYDVQLYRDGTRKTGGIQEVSGTKKELDFEPLMKTAGSYTFKVREKNMDSKKKGEWVESDNSYDVSEEEAAKNKEAHSVSTTSIYGWKQNDIGWWYVIPGGYYTNTWSKVNDRWYYFNNDGYMLKGWQNLNGKWYYLNPQQGGPEGAAVSGWNQIDNKWYYFDNSCAMLQDTMTPDGYRVGADGALVEN